MFKNHAGSAMFLLVLASWLSAAEDAQYIGCVIPESLITDEVFEARISMKNTGTTTWGSSSGQTPVTLVSQNPKCTMTWGTWFIILGQGNAIAPGDTFTFHSRLKAPSSPGTYDFGWQIERWLGGGGSFDTTTPFFGDTVTGESIYVSQRLETPPPPPLHKDSLLDSSDFEYMGSFKVPNIPGQEDKYTESGLALKDVGGTKNLLVRTGTYNFRLYEMTIPELEKIEDGDYSLVHTGSVVQDWGELAYGTIGGENIGSNCGFWYEDSSSIIYWSHYNAYYAGGASGFPQLMATRLNPGGTKTNIDYWYIPGNQGPYKSYWGGPLKLSKDFADTYTGGRDMAMGFGGYYSICGSASRGPALGAIARPDTANTTLDLVAMMNYTDPSASVRDGKYLPVVGYWDDAPPSPWEGKWTYNDICHAGVFIDLPDKKGYLAFVEQVTGRIGYDYGGYNTDGHSQNCWYFYDIKDLGAVALGNLRPDSIKPASFVTINYPTGKTFIRSRPVQGACFDSLSRMVYIYVQRVQDNGEPMIHAYRIKETPAAIEVAGRAGKKQEIMVYPNPFNPVTTITITTSQLPASPAKRSERITNPELKIFDINGKQVADLSQNTRNLKFVIRSPRVAAGEAGNSFIWDASAQPSGVYIIKARTGEKVLTKVITLVK
ncbi:MAG: hypothetical protein A2268_03835 [Candidatus Raymondbacteria bacterium RifOxyA12_full_50_37]|uniref:Uncharacterized protein n=1 Tax=Candidatus Raymondbacteria bacterium RIFOXYD12_FULL_49_13 TaxID=1817890 RepID=A0A1F7FBB9_UNCRA|nr:MAG: hypothetical protein A2268_03835 [Candidatus Raymondbacteria bacterium RifOxyA12_full_50_37]OGJ92199.1 MAG: hypothetical protein A2350_14880 [Candidatus Raymondbacteria bacterium RifOxyB12_full_50_8]OGJ92644.1 MAG: hypothetical protein A2248_06115 [Candidatus Raymondbacteria bacterium RIFOXYA2_FULL_49_16]OGJ97998.1 MAG: hypothetical protein A2453_03140 [Candidatus Raymondbacteria bacterium RIFOXYC2_FULL_50_21]OGJ99862.1 MAG: hypothetical protein A2487_10940 [Candidatus Raymondbacteria b